MINILLLILAIFTSLIAVLNSVFVFMFPDGSALWNTSRFLVSVFIIIVGGLTWSFVRLKSSKNNLRQLLFFCSIGLVVLGILGTLHAIYLGQTTGDFEYYLFPIHALLFGQGALTFGFGGLPSIIYRLLNRWFFLDIKK